MKRCNYWCRDCTCGAKVRNFVIPKENYEGDEYCPHNESEDAQPMKLMGEIPYGGPMKFQSMTSQQRREVLKKRSREHYQKKVKDKAIEMNKTPKL